MGLAEYERKKDEKINGVIYDMSPAPGFRHGIINSCLYTHLKGSEINMRFWLTQT